ncbi:hypothetical protein ElyMa_004884100 [Elysia marginata]|uniref:Uncharacterized protein n=1 Tax=Elysia marginata TaxID=1093978 RepID=A0AAV4IVL3_9GAST|nr:hypothetical protein ElyMa_004884100 [Elysia marginata]
MLEDLEEKRSQSSQQVHHLPPGFPGLRMSRSYHGYHGPRTSHFGGGVGSQACSGNSGKLGDGHPLEGTRLLRASTSPHVVAPTHTSLSHLCPNSSRSNSGHSHTPTCSTYYSYSPATVSTSTSSGRAPRRPEPSTTQQQQQQQQQQHQQQQRQQRNHNHHFYHLPHPKAKSQSYECVPLVAKQSRQSAETGASGKSRGRNPTAARGYSFPSLPSVRSGLPLRRGDSLPSPTEGHTNALSYPDLANQVETVI